MDKIKYYLIGATCIIASGYFFYVVFTQYNIPPEPPLPDFVTPDFLLAVYPETGPSSPLGLFYRGTYFIDIAIGEEDRSSTVFISREENVTIDLRFCSLNFETVWDGHYQSLTIIITEPHQKYTLYDHERQTIGDPNSYYYWRDTGERINQTHRPHVELHYDPTHLDIHDEIEIYVNIRVWISHEFELRGAEDIHTLKLKTVSEDEYNALKTHWDWQWIRGSIRCDDAVREKNSNILYGGISLIIGLIVIWYHTPDPISHVSS